MSGLFETTDADIAFTKSDYCPVVREIEHHFDQDIPQYWAGNNPVITAYFNALSTIIPEGEKFFISSVRDAHLKGVNPELDAQVKAFIQQEASHSGSHHALNDWIASQGYPIKKSEGVIRSILKRSKGFFSVKQRLAGTLALEHFSAMLSDQFLRQESIHSIIHPAMRELLIWHSIEEAEHKAVAYDVYQTHYNDYWVRIWQLLLVSLFFIPNVCWVQLRYLWHDGHLFNFKAWAGAFHYFWMGPGWFRRIVPSYFHYLSPNFHPWKHNNQPLLNHWIMRFNKGDC